MIKKYKNYEELKKQAKEEETIPDKPAACYFRCSTFKQIANSLVYQNDEIKMYAAKKGYKIIKEYRDGGKTGAFDNRKGFQEIMEDVRAGVEWKYLLVYSDSRFVRNSIDGESYESLLKSYGIKLISVSEEFDDDNPQDRKLKRMQRCYNENFLDDVRTSTSDGLFAKARRGIHCGGIPPLGYDVVDKKLVINPLEKECVKRIFDLYENNISYSEIARILNEEGYRTKTGAKFGKNSFNAILTNPKYTGLFVWNRRASKDEKGRHNNHREKPIEKQVVLEKGVPQIISEAQFERVQNKIEARKLGEGEPLTRYHYALSSKKLLKCKKCGAYLEGYMQSSHGKKYRVYRCPNHKKGICETKEIRADRLENFVLYSLVDTIFENEDLQKLTDVFNYDFDEKAIKDKIADVDFSIKNITKSLKKHCSDILLEQLEELEEEKNGLCVQLEKHESQKFEFNENTLPKVKIRVQKYLKNTPDLEATRLFKTAIKMIYVNNDCVEMEMEA